jgi:predicted ATPase
VGPLIDRISIHGYRAAREVELRPRRLCALVGEAASGKSTVLTALWSLLESAAPVPTAEDVSHGGDRVHLEADVEGGTIFLDASPPATLNLNREGAPPVLFLPASLRSSGVAAPASARAVVRAAALLQREGDLVGGIERLCDEGTHGLVVLIEEPELFLSPQAQRYLYRLLRRLAEDGNQVLYTTHASTFLSVAHLEELVLVRHRDDTGTSLCQPEALATDESFRALSEFDAERSEVFLARAALIVEGMTEKLALPFAFDALGYDPDREAVAIVECGGKANIPLFARICDECGIPFVVVHDRDAPRGEAPNESEQVTNAAILKVAGRSRVVTLVPDFEAIVGVTSRRGRKPQKAYARFRNGTPVPKPLVEAVQRAVAAARGVSETSGRRAA